MKEIPDSEQIKGYVVEVFERASEIRNCEILGALVPFSIEPIRMIHTFPDYEMEELCRFVNQFNAYIRESENCGDLTRLRLLVYCHVMEAEVAPALIWNLLRLIVGQEPRWDFVGVDDRGRDRACEYAWQRFAEIARLSQEANLGIGPVLETLWQNKLRNAFSHAQYVTLENGDFLGGKNISPLSASVVRPSDTAEDSGENPYYYKAAEVERLSDSALSWLWAVTECYKVGVQPFKDGDFHEFPSGPIRWDGERGWWATS